ncbi:MAG: hypothetical protein K6F94_04145 [Bacteroidaceae bacterium]|nr:hypothetical protein [Bacteroidaceae bacterium]
MRSGVVRREKQSSILVGSGVTSVSGNVFDDIESTALVIITRIYDVKAGCGIIVKAAEGSYEIPVKEEESIVSNMLSRRLIGRGKEFTTRKVLLP